MQANSMLRGVFFFNSRVEKSRHTGLVFRFLSDFPRTGLVKVLARQAGIRW